MTGYQKAIAWHHFQNVQQVFNDLGKLVLSSEDKKLKSEKLRSTC